MLRCQGLAVAYYGCALERLANERIALAKYSGYIHEKIMEQKKKNKLANRSIKGNHLVTDDLKHFWGNHIKIHAHDQDLDFLQAKELAKEKAMELSPDPMLLSWYNGKTGEYYPKLECGTWDKPVWIIFAQSRGADIAVNINDGEYVFLYLSLL